MEGCRGGREREERYIMVLLLRLYSNPTNPELHFFFLSSLLVSFSISHPP